MCALLLSASALCANDRDEEKPNSTEKRRNNRSEFAQSCNAAFEQVKVAEKAGEAGATEVANLKADPKYKVCESAEKLSKHINNSKIEVQGGYQTSDGKATCAQYAGYTFDYQSCKSTAKVYNALLVAATLLETQAEVRAQNSQSEIGAKAQQKAMSGDVQGAGLEASKDNSSMMKQIHMQRAAAYGAAVAALGAKIAGWTGDAEKVCSQAGCNPAEVASILEHAGESEVFGNEGAKAVFIQALSEYAAKGVAAGINANNYKKSEETVAKIQESYEEDKLDVELEECVINPTAKKCLGPGTRVPGQSYTAGSGNFSLGDNGSNVFDLGSETEDFGELGDIANVESQQVAGIGSPFEDAAKEANDILNQPSAASAGSGEAPAGGGGGGGGMGGGGSASLGNDTKTPDETNEEAEIKAKKSSGSYASSGATGFSAVKSGKEDGNPFASLFDQKGSSGGIEEDRSIASNDIDDKSSVLFKKISKKYSEMHSSKRIQANNLELE